MTPREILEKYNLSTDVKSIRERIFKLLLLHDVDETVVWYDVELTGIQAMEVCNLVSLLCELVEKGERAEEVVEMMNTLNPIDFGKDRPGWTPTIADYHEWLRQEIINILKGDPR